jgi:hypothetical protein
MVLKKNLLLIKKIIYNIIYMSWIEALKSWNKKKGGKYTIPKKGTKEYNEVKALMKK